MYPRALSLPAHRERYRGRIQKNWSKLGGEDYVVEETSSLTKLGIWVMPVSDSIPPLTETLLYAKLDMQTQLLFKANKHNFIMDTVSRATLGQDQELMFKRKTLLKGRH